jgi:hypothetical protein
MLQATATCATAMLQALLLACGEELIPAGKAMESIRRDGADWRTWVLSCLPDIFPQHLQAGFPPVETASTISCGTNWLRLPDEHHPSIKNSRRLDIAGCARCQGGWAYRDGMSTVEGAVASITDTHHRIQFCTFIPAMRRNSPSLLVTTVRPAALACAAIHKSLLPIGRP